MSIAHRVSAGNRMRKWELFVQEFGLTSEATILDAGYSDQEYSAVDNFLEKHHPYPNRITALGIDEPTEFPGRYPEVKVVQYDGREFPFKDNTFDICWSNAVIEHVGGPADQLLFLREMMRVSKAVFFTTPNRYFPVEPHTRTPLLHYLPKRIFDGYLRLVGKSWATGGYMHLLGLRQIKGMLREAGVGQHKVVKNRFMGFVLDYVVMIGNDKRASR